jgi:cold-inducible RNA-binding protein
MKGMVKTLYVGGLSYGTTEAELRSAFEAAGQVASVRLITDRDTGQSKGFAFVEMADEAATDRAMTMLNGAQLGGRTLVVNEARPREERGRGGNGGRGGRRSY